MRALPITKNTKTAGLKLQSSVEQLATKSVDLLMKNPERYEHLGSNANKILHDGFVFLIRMLANTMIYEQLDILNRQMDWSVTRLPHDGITPSMLITNLNGFRTVVDENMSADDAREINNMIDWMIEYLRGASTEETWNQ